VLDYVRDLGQENLDRIIDSRRDFERYAEIFMRLVETKEERALGAKVAVLNRE